jgi:hypothetical protein
VISGVGALIAAFAAVLIPTDGGHDHLPVAAEIGAAAPLPDPAYATEG